MIILEAMYASAQLWSSALTPNHKVRLGVRALDHNVRLGVRALDHKVRLGVRVLDHKVRG